MTIYGWLLRICACRNTFSRLIHVCVCLECLKSDLNTHRTMQNDYIQLTFENAFHERTPLHCSSLCLCLPRISQKWPQHSNYYVEWLYTAGFSEYLPGKTPWLMLSMSVSTDNFSKATPTLNLLRGMTIYGWISRMRAERKHLFSVIYVCVHLKCLKSELNTEFTT